MVLSVQNVHVSGYLSSKNNNSRSAYFAVVYTYVYIDSLIKLF